MKLSNEKILNDAAALGQITQKQLPVKISYAIAKNIKKIESELNIYNTEKQKLIDKYSVADDEGNVKIAEENIEDWNKEITELLEIENEIDIHKFNVNDLINSNCNFTPAELMIIDYMIEE